MKSLFLKIVIVLVVFFLVGKSAVSAGPDWVGWRGESRDGTVAGREWPRDLGEAKLVRKWRVTLAEGYPGPIVSGDRVFTVETQNKENEVVRAFHRDTGKQLWERGWSGSMKVPFFAAKNGSWVRSTPATDGRLLFVGGMREVLVALDVETGKVRWRFDFGAKLKSDLPSFGFVCSPLVDEGSVYVQAGGGICKLDAVSGDLLWHTPGGGGGMSGGAFSSPILASISGSKQLIVQGRDELKGLNPQSGSVLWHQPVKAFRGMNIVTPVPYGDSFFTTTYGGRSILWGIEEAEGGYGVEQSWVNKLQGYMCTPVVVDDHAYFHLKSQRAACVDLRSGEIRWVSDQRFGKYWSLVAQGDRLLALDERGDLILFKANPEAFEMIDRRKVSEEETWGHLTVVDGEIYIRELNGLSAWRWNGETHISLHKQ